MPAAIALRIAVVDDDPSLRQALLGLLRSLGFRGRGYGNAEEFLASGIESDCLLTDYHMPGASGLDLLRRLRDSGDEMPAILMSGHDETGLRERAIANGARCLLAKPFTEEQLMDCLREALPGLALDTG